MLLQALTAYADYYLVDELSAEAWESKPVPALIEVGADGKFFNIIQRRIQEPRGKKTITIAQPLTVPKSPVNRNSGIYPLLAADDIKYVLGPGPWTADKDRDNASVRHAAFVQLVKAAAAATKDAALASCSLFYERADQVELAKEAMCAEKAGTIVALSVGGPVVRRAAVANYWNQHFQEAFAERISSGGTAECLITGKIGPIAPTHEKIKGVSSLGGQAAGVSLMSFDKAAFRSYGWDQNANSPVSPERANAYVLALNDLLKTGKGHRRDIAGVGYIYWTRKPTSADPLNILEDPRDEEVAKLLSLQRVDLDPNMFYLAGVSGNGGRLLVRYWLAESLPQIQANVKSWFDDLRIISPNGQRNGTAPSMWQLRSALHREGEPPAPRVLALFRRALQGQSSPLGFDVLNGLLSRMRHRPEAARPGEQKEDYRFAPSRIGLLRLCVNDLSQGEQDMKEQLDPDQKNPAYLCGRLLAEYENLQSATYRAAEESKVNMTVTDRYYSLASTNPSMAFPKIAVLGRAHFRKLQRDKPGTKRAIERQIEELGEQIGPRFPGLLKLTDQGRFALGYYHQKAQQSRERAERFKDKTVNYEDTQEEQQ